MLQYVIYTIRKIYRITMKWDILFAATQLFSERDSPGNTPDGGIHPVPPRQTHRAPGHQGATDRWDRVGPFTHPRGSQDMHVPSGKR